jgi:hypothetical protein
VHSRYERRLADTAVAGQEVVIQLRVRRFFCPGGTCGKKTFAEQVPGLTIRYGRVSTGLREALRAIAMALGGAGRAPGARPGRRPHDDQTPRTGPGDCETGNALAGTLLPA